MSCSELLFLLASYDILAEAYEESREYLSEPLDEPDEWLINLQNHLLWHTYEVAVDEDADAVVLTAIGLVMKAKRIKANDLTGEVKAILNDLTLV